MIEEEDISTMKRKNRQADNIMLANNVGDMDDEEDEEGSQLVHNGEAMGITPKKARGAFNLNDSDDDYDEYNDGNKKQLLDESDFALNEKRQNIPMPGSSSS